MNSEIVYPEQLIKVIINNGILYTQNLVGCFATSVYCITRQNTILAMGHHSSLITHVISREWREFYDKHPELRDPLFFHILGARMKPEPDDEFNHLTYKQRFEEVMNFLKEQFPSAYSTSAYYAEPGQLTASLDNLTWNTNLERGKLRFR